MGGVYHLIGTAGAHDVPFALVEVHHVEHMLLVLLHAAGQVAAAAAAVLAHTPAASTSATAHCGIDVPIAPQLGVLLSVHPQKLSHFVAVERPAPRTMILDALCHLTLQNSGI